MLSRSCSSGQCHDLCCHVLISIDAVTEVCSDGACAGMETLPVCHGAMPCCGNMLPFRSPSPGHHNVVASRHAATSKIFLLFQHAELKHWQSEPASDRPSNTMLTHESEWCSDRPVVSGSRKCPHCRMPSLQEMERVHRISF